MAIFEKLSAYNEEKVNEMSLLAGRIVKEHYDPIIGPVQNDYMIKMFQSPAGIKEQISHGSRFYFVKADSGENCGYMAFYPRGTEMYLSKLYVDKSFRGQGISNSMMDFLIAEAKNDGLKSITLNVNKYNKSLEVYEHMGFVRIREEVNDIGNGYVMDDYVYELKI